MFFVAHAVAAEAAATQPSQDQVPSPSTSAAAQDAPPAEASTAPAVPNAAPPVTAATGSAAPSVSSEVAVIAYVKHTKPPLLVDSTPATAGFAMVGALAAIAAGHSIVVDNEIQDPSGDMAREIASAYAAAHGARVADGPVLDGHLWAAAKAESLAEKSTDARYVVDVEPPGMTLIYFTFDWTHFDLIFGTRARIIDTSNNRVISQARCFMRTEKSPDLLGHQQLLADRAAALKLLIIRKSEACVAKMKADLKL